MTEAAGARIQLLKQVEQIALRARRIVVLHALALGLLIALTGFWLLAAVDVTVHLENVGLRWLLFASFLLVVTLVWRQVVQPGLAFRPELVETARQLELSVPQLGQRLSSCVSLLLAAEGRPLRPMEIQLLSRVESELRQLSLEGCLNSRRARKVVFCLVAFLGILTGFWIWQPASSLLAAGRLVQPWKEQAWPRRFHLELLQPASRLAIGDSYRMTLGERQGKLPADLAVEIVRDGQTSIERHLVSSAGASADFEWGPVRRSFRIRAVGGDDFRMPWHRVEVLEAARIEQLQIFLDSPEYSGRGRELVQGDIHMLAGTRVSIRLTLDRPCRDVELVFQSSDGESNLRRPLQRIRGGRRFELGSAGDAWMPENTGEYWLEIEGEVSHSTPRRNLRLVEDEAPVVIMTLPGREEVYWYRAEVALAAEVRDDVGVRDIQLRYGMVGMDSEHEIIQLRQALADRPDEGTASAQGDHRHLHYSWDLDRLEGLAPGSSLQVELLASDHAGNISSSTSRVLRLVTRQAMLDHLQKQVVRVSDAMGSMASHARQIQTQIDQLLEDVHSQTQEGVLDDQLQQVLLHHQQLSEQLVGRDGNMLATVEQLLSATQQNRLQGADLQQQLDQLKDGLQRLDAELLPGVEQYLSASWKLTSSTQVVPSQLEPLLEEASRLQAKVVRELEQQQIASTQLDRYRTLLERLQDQRDDQRQLQADTGAAQLHRITGSPTPGGQSLEEWLRALEERQRRLGDRWLELRQQWKNLADQPGLDKERRTAIMRAWTAPVELPVAGLQLDVRRALVAQQTGRAVDGMQQICDLLDRRLKLLGALSSVQLQQQAAAQGALSDRIDELIERQRELVVRLNEAAAEDEDSMRKQLRESLAAAQEELSGRLQELTERQQEHSGGQAAGDWFDAAVSASDVAVARIGKDLLSQARESQGKVVAALEAARAVGEGQQAEDELRLSHRQLDELRQPLEEIRVEQEEIWEATRRLAPSAGSLTRQQQLEARELARREIRLSQRATQLALPELRWGSIRLTLRTVATEMRQAGRRLMNTDVGLAQQHQEVSLALLEDIEHALAQLLTAPATLADQTAEDSAGDPVGAFFRAPAELQLLIELQKQLNLRTRLLETARQRQGKWTAEQSREVSELAERQQQLVNEVAGLRGQRSSGRNANLDVESGGQP